MGIYLGASDISFGKYVCGTMLGLFPSVIAFSVMGMSADDLGSPAFVLSAVAEVGLCLMSVLLYVLWSKKKKKKAETLSNTEDES